jgi:Fe-S-cluster containining protein
MAALRVVRPLVRSFQKRFLDRAAEHVRAGGHAIVWSSERRAMIVIPLPNDDDPMDLGMWSLLDMRKSQWTIENRGTLRGLATASVPSDCLDLVKERVERDSVHRGTVRVMRLDCETCAACCRKNRVELEKADVVRFRKAGREDLLRRPYVRRDGTKLVLRLLKSGDCRHLQKDNRCGIYPVRPEACRTFPPGSEGCLFSREEELGIVDA